MQSEVAEVLGGAAVEVAPRLLGATISHATEQGTVAIRLTEVEAYDESEPAAHTFRGPTPRTEPMFRRGGHLYVYLSHGIHLCCNVVCGPAGRGAAVLLRGGVVVRGRDLAVARRSGRDGDDWLAAGPGRLGQALGIDLASSGEWLLGGAATTLQLDEPVDPEAVATGPRVGVTKAAELPWRFWVRGARGMSAHRSGT